MSHATPHIWVSNFENVCMDGYLNTETTAAHTHTLQRILQHTATHMCIDTYVDTYLHTFSQNSPVHGEHSQKSALLFFHMVFAVAR